MPSFFFLQAGDRDDGARDDEHQYQRNRSSQHHGITKLATAASMQTVLWDTNELLILTKPLFLWSMKGAKYPARFFTLSQILI